MAALIWRERLALKNEREFLGKQVAAQQESLSANFKQVRTEREHVTKIVQILSRHRAILDPSLRTELEKVLNRRPPPLSDSELDRIKRDSAALGAPQPAPLPPGFGGKPN
jgi:hypothetical protein